MARLRVCSSCMQCVFERTPFGAIVDVGAAVGIEVFPEQFEDVFNWLKKFHNFETKPCFWYYNKG